MMWLTAVLVSFLAVTALGTHLTSTGVRRAIPAHLLDQGDGAYVATADDNGKANVTFTPMAVLLAHNAALPNIAPEAFDVPDEDIYCERGGSQNEHDLNMVNEKVIKWAQSTEFPAKSWGWIHFNKETSYICPYAPWVGNSAVVLAGHTTITRACNSRAKYGWIRLRGTETLSGDPAPNFSIGRTYRGNDFCAVGHAPPANPNENDEGSLDLRDGLHSHDKATVTQLAIPDHLRDQGDGFYVATRDATGKVNVKFTSMAVLIAEDAALPPKNVAPAIDNIGALDVEIWCDGVAKNAYDLKWANEKVCQLFSDMELPSQTWAWFHNVHQTSFICPYTAWSGDFSAISDAHNTISKSCKNQASYGFVRLKGGKEIYNYAIDVSIGRTRRGSNFCNDNFAPPFNTDPGDSHSTFAPESLDQRDTLVAPEDVLPNQAEEVHDKRDESLHQAESSMDQGDGLYTARFDDTGKMTVEFTSKAELVARDAEALRKRKIETWCAKRQSAKTHDLDWAIEQLGKNAQGVHYAARHWGWVHNEQETAFFCPYIPWDGSSYNIDELNKRIDEACGSRANYGWFRHVPRVGDKGLPNYSVGRTWRGSAICEDGFVPGSIQPDEFDQGNGFYAAILDEDTGKVNITFTPKDMLLARNAVSDNPTTKSIRALEKRDGVECVDGESKNKADLDYATRRVAEGVEGERYDPTVWTWFHNNKETVYVCCYRAWHGSTKTVWDYIRYINEGCVSETEYGYNHHAAQNEADINLTVGRTWRGNKFCDRFFHPNPPSGGNSPTGVPKPADRDV